MKSKKIYPKKNSAGPGDKKSRGATDKTTSSYNGRRSTAKPLEEFKSEKDRKPKTEKPSKRFGESETDPAKTPYYSRRRSRVLDPEDSFNRSQKKARVVREMAESKGQRAESREHASTPLSTRKAEGKKASVKSTLGARKDGKVEKADKRNHNFKSPSVDFGTDGRKGGRAEARGSMKAFGVEKAEKQKGGKAEKEELRKGRRSEKAEDMLRLRSAQEGQGVKDQEGNSKALFVEETAETEKVAPAYSRKREAETDMRLNKYIAHCGIASRRAADTLIMQGHVTVNGAVVQEMGYKVQANDVVAFKGKVVRAVDKMVYFLLNKPTNVLTTSSDERGRKTVIDIMTEKIPERIYPVGRLDRNTSGLLLMTNDGELTKKLSHPSYKVPKVYQVMLDKNLSLKDMEKIREGITLEDGDIKADSLHYTEGMSKREVQIEVHSGKNRLVRRIFEHLGYEVVKLDRTYYAGLTKKNLPRGVFRPLTKEEVRMLKHFT